MLTTHAQSSVLAMIVFQAIFTDASSGAIAPRMQIYPQQTPIAGVPLSWPSPVLDAGDLPVFWSLYNAPEGMIIDPLTGTITWTTPLEGPYKMTVTATNSAGNDAQEYYFYIVPNDVSTGRIVATKYIDFQVPGDIAAWIESRHARAYVDAYWEQMSRLIGQEPAEYKQIMRYDPSLGGWAWSGNPATAGPLFWSTDPISGWGLGIFFHEVGHNFQALTNIGRINGDNWADAFFHHGSEVLAPAVQYRALERPDLFGLTGQSLVEYRGWCDEQRAEMDRRCNEYRNHLRGGGHAEGFSGDAYGAWGWMCRQIMERHGVQALENTWRALRVDGLPASVYDAADTPSKKNTLLFCIMSAAADYDLRSFFRDWGFSTNDPLYEALRPEVAQVVANLPHEDADGWKKCPLNGHDYRLTQWSMHAREAERAAQRRGGHLVTIRSAAEGEWLQSRFANRRPLWLGATDQSSEGNWGWFSLEALAYTNWASGEPNGNRGENFALFMWYDTPTWIDVDESGRFFGVIERITSPVHVKADLDDDGDIDKNDFSVFAGCGSGAAVPQADPTCRLADLDADQDVDQDDFGMLQRCWSGTNTPPPLDCR